MNFTNDKYGLFTFNKESNDFVDKQQQTKDEDDFKLRGLFGVNPKSSDLDLDIGKSDNKYISEFESLFLKPNVTFDEGGALRNLNEELIR